MDQPPRYDELLPDDDDESSAVIMTLVVPPPSPEDTRPSTPVPPEDPKDENDPPPYNIAATLPSYDDVQKQKDTEPLMNEDPESGNREQHNMDMDLGGDVMFICTFIIAFIFNWVGLLFSFCMTTTVAGRYGAISGFGLSIVKWVVIMMHTASLTDYVDTLPCLWWILLILGMMLFLRGAIMYVKVKRQFMSGTRTRFSYFYIY